MRSRPCEHIRNAQAGGITILVVLMLLVLLTITVFGLSKNAIRENIIAGTARQGLEVRNVADAGLEWGVFWLDPSNTATSSNPGALALQSEANTLLVDTTLAGAYQALPGSAKSDMVLQDVSGTDTQYFDMNLMSMGKLPVVMVSQNVIATNSPSAVLYPDLWSERANAHYVQGGAVDFVHSKETWISTAARAVNQ